MYMKSTSNMNKNQKSCLTGLLKLFVACSSWSILKLRLNHILHCHLLRIFESFQDTSKLLIFTLLIKTSRQPHLKMLRCSFHFLKNLIDFRHIILQPARKLKNSFMKGVLQIKHFFPSSSISFLPSPIFCLLSFIFRFVNILDTLTLQKITFRSSHRKCSVRKDVLKTFAKFTEKHLCQSLFFNKVVGQSLQLY